MSARSRGKPHAAHRHLAPVILPPLLAGFEGERRSAFAELSDKGGNKRVRLTSRRGSIEAEAWVTDRVPPGMVYGNFHFPEASVNYLTIAALDPVAKIPEFKVCAVKVEAVTSIA